MERIGRAYYRFMNLEWLLEWGVPYALVVAGLLFGVGVLGVISGYCKLC